MKVSEPNSFYQSKDMSVCKWVEVLVDCPYAQGSYTYRCSSAIAIDVGDIVSVPFGKSLLGGITIAVSTSPPTNIPLDTVKEIDDVVAPNFFPPHYWSLLHRTAQYYCTDLMQVVRAALPPKLLGKSQRRVKLLEDKLSEGWENFCSVKEIQIIQLLQQSKSGDYSYKYIQQKIHRSYQVINRLVKKGWFASNFLTNLFLKNSS